MYIIFMYNYNMYMYVAIYLGMYVQGVCIANSAHNINFLYVSVIHWLLHANCSTHISIDLCMCVSCNMQGFGVLPCMFHITCIEHTCSLLKRKCCMLLASMLHPCSIIKPST